MIVESAFSPAERPLRIWLVQIGEEMPFAVEGIRRAAMLQGLDEIGLTLQQDAAIAAFQGRDRAKRPWFWQPGVGEDA